MQLVNILIFLNWPQAEVNVIPPQIQGSVRSQVPPRGAGATEHSLYLLVSCVQRVKQGLRQAQGDIGLPTSEQTFAFRKHLSSQGQVSSQGGTGITVPAAERLVGAGPCGHQVHYLPQQSRQLCKVHGTSPMF